MRDFEDTSYRTLGRTGLRVSPVSMGTWQTFDVREEKRVRAVGTLVTEAVELGVNFFDTAPMYGAAESVLGDALKKCKQRVMVATKVLASDGASAERSVEESLERLQRDEIDLMQIHNMSAWQRVAPVLQKYRSKGRIRFLGITDYRQSKFGDMADAKKTGLFDTIQIPYNIADRSAERELLPLAKKLDLGVLVMTPLSPISNRASLFDVLKSKDLTFLRPYGITTPGQALLAYLLAKSPQVVLLPATSRLNRVSENVAAGTNKSVLGREEVSQFEALFSRG